jgi:hypothetical protein
MIASALQGKALVELDALDISCALSFGGIQILKNAWDRFGMDAVFSDVTDVRSRSLLKAMIFSRVLFPSSKLALSEEAKGTALSLACGLSQEEDFDEDDLYKAMDGLNGRWVGVERKLAKIQGTNEACVVLYDLTSVYFEGSGPKHLARYGYSRDHRGDRRQCLVAVATDGKGIPIHVEVLRGNRPDQKTLLGLLKTLEKRFGIRKAIFTNESSAEKY